MKMQCLFNWILVFFMTLFVCRSARAQLCPAFSSVYSGLPGLANGSVAWGDYDNDGKLDILLTGQGNQNYGAPISQIWRNVEGGSFININAGLPGVAYGSVAWGDYDNDGNLDILLTGKTNQNLNSVVSQIWHNRGDGTFANINAGLPGVAYGSVAWGDYDNDGKLDIVLTGLQANGIAVCQIWRNLGNGSFTNINAGLPGVYLSSAAWGDFDGDGKLDLLVTGMLNTGVPISKLWWNAGEGSFLEIDAGLPGVEQGAVAWGDFDNDGRPDILLTGVDEFGYAIAGVYWNTGYGYFYDINAGLPGVWHSSVAWGDFDNDGRTDILLMGFINNPVNNPTNTPILQVWRNQDNWTFVNFDAGFPELLNGTAVFGDYDGDDKLDIFITGNPKNNPFALSQIWRNNTLHTNSVPNSPTGLASYVTGNGVILTWSPGGDDQTPYPALSYNIRIGKTPGGFDILTPQADVVSGVRRLPQMGNGQQRLTASMNDLDSGTYFWSVQAVDSAFVASPFANEESFTLGPPVILNTGVDSYGNFQLTLGGSTAPGYLIQVSTNLVDWVDYTFVGLGANGQGVFIDWETVNYPVRYFRAIEL
jgi:FG-GAP-like repeat